VAYFLFVLLPYSSIRQFVLWMGVSALRSWHGLGESFSWENGSLEGICFSWNIYWFSGLICSSREIWLYFIIVGGRDVVGKVERGDIEVDGWCVVGMGSVTGSDV
jgi:hypothetical protein